MDIEAFNELFPFFSIASPETLEWLLPTIHEHEYTAEQMILQEDNWGNAVYLIESGWVRLRRLGGDRPVTHRILGKGSFFGELSVIDEFPQETDAIALSTVKLLQVPAQRFIQLLFRDSEIQHRLLQLMVRRLREANNRSARRDSISPGSKLLKTILQLAESYGEITAQGTGIFQLSHQELADLADISPSKVASILEKLTDNGLILAEAGQFHLKDLEQWHRLANRA